MERICNLVTFISGEDKDEEPVSFLIGQGAMLEYKDNTYRITRVIKSELINRITMYFTTAIDINKHEV